MINVFPNLGKRAEYFASLMLFRIKVEEISTIGALINCTLG
jgi:hypothetical protein